MSELVKKSLYQLTAEMTALFNSDEEVTEEQLQTVFGEITTKAESTLNFLSAVAGEVSLYDAEIKRLTERKRTLDNLYARVKDCIK